MSERRRSSSGFVLVADTPLPVEALRDLRRALTAAGPPGAVLATRCATLLATAGDRHRIEELADALRLAVDAASIGGEVAEAALGVREALGVSGAVAKDARDRVPTPYTGGEKGR